MGILSRLLRSKDSAMDWIREPGVRLALAFTEGTLSGVGLGEPYERLAFLGPPQPRRSPQDDLTFLALGVSVSVTDGKIDSISLWWRDYLDLGLDPYSGAILLKDRELHWGSMTSEDEIVATVGAPYWKDQDDGEIILFYEVEDRWGQLTERQVELDADGRLQALLVRTEPMLADPEQRQAYAVAKPWPPR